MNSLTEFIEKIIWKLMDFNLFQNEEWFSWNSSNPSKFFYLSFRVSLKE
jgi:hypothetical protein